MHIKRLLFFAVLSLSLHSVIAYAQTAGSSKKDTSAAADLMAMMDQPSAKKSKPYTIATFKSTRLINGHTTEHVGKGVLDFRISHRFGAVDQGASNFFGLDNAVTKLAFDYGVTDWLMVGIGRSTYEKEYDGYFKIKLLRQTEDDKMPISLNYMGAMSAQTMPMPNVNGREYEIGNRLYYVNQLLIARKFCKWLSVQLMPTHIHYNIVPLSSDPNDVLALGIGGRMKMSNRIALTAEYYYTVPGNKLEGYNNAFSVGIDIETGGHVFQLLFTNATGITERSFIGQTTGQGVKGDIHFGFNISRVFTVVHPKEFKDSRNKTW